MKVFQSKEWAAIAAVLAAIATELPAISAAAQGEMDKAGGKINWVGALLVVIGVLARANIGTKQENKDLHLDKLALHGEVVNLAAKHDAATAVLEAARQGLPTAVVYGAQQPAQTQELPKL